MNIYRLMAAAFPFSLAVIIALTYNLASLNASILEMESPPIQTNMNTTNDTQDIDLAINVDDMEEDALFENRTQSLSRGGATDIDIDGFPPEDVTVIVTSEKVFVTRSPWNLDLTDEIKEELRRQIADPLP